MSPVRILLCVKLVLLELKVQECLLMSVVKLTFTIKIIHLRMMNCHGCPEAKQRDEVRGVNPVRMEFVIFLNMCIF